MTALNHTRSCRAPALVTFCSECLRGIHIYCEDDGGSMTECDCRCRDGLPCVTDGPIATAEDEAKLRWSQPAGGAAA